MSEKPVLAIGDVQGNLPRLEALLLQEGILGPCGVCAGTGDVSGSDDEATEFCPICKGTGTARINHDVTVVQLGDLIDARPETQTADSLCVHFADMWVDYVLWGNHDRPVIDPRIPFGGYETPLPEVVHKMKLMMHEGRYRLAYAAHGFLLVHAGVHPWFGHEMFHSHEDLDRADPGMVAEYFNTLDEASPGNGFWDLKRMLTAEALRDFERLRDGISPYRGGWKNEPGGLLWRDSHEGLYDGLKQVFGHSSAPTARKLGNSYCLDISKHGGVAAIWLPEERIVEVKDEVPSPA